MSALLVDIETVSLAEADAYLEPVEAPANYKDPAKIDAYCRERRAELLTKCALDPDLCRIVSIGWDEGELAHAAPLLTQADERVELALFWHVAARTPHLLGFNLLGFDLPVLIRRSQYLGVESIALNLDRYRTPHVDLMERLSFNGKLKMRSLDFYCKRFGIVVDDPHSGADVAALVAAGDWSAVTAHCRADLRKTRALAERLGFLIPSTEPAGVL